MSALCVAALAAGLGWRLDLQRFDLVWTHSVEKTEWRETWQVEEERLRLVEASVQGFGAGMEPPPEARLVEDHLLGDRWIWQPAPGSASYPSLSLARSGAVADYRLCTAAAGCRDLAAWLPGLGESGGVELRPCP